MKDKDVRLLASGVDDALFECALDLTAEWCRIPSHADNRAGLRQQASALRAWLGSLPGIRMIAGTREEDFGFLHAFLDAGAARTVILYNMFDVMPATPENWEVDPWEGGRMELPGIGPVFAARGAENSKGPLAGMLAVLANLSERGLLPVNVEILLDGAEETGSSPLRAYLGAKDCPVRHSVGGLFPSFCEYGGGPARLYLGFSGIAKGQLSISGGSWGGPGRAIHSSNAAWISNPALVLVEAISRIADSATGVLSGFTIDEDTRALVEKLAEDFDPDAELRFRNTERYMIEGDGSTLLEHVLTSSTFNISSLATDPPGADAVIPRAATASFEVRCPPGDYPDRHLNAIRRCIAASPALSGVNMEVANSYPGYRVETISRAVSALEEAYSETSPFPPQIWPWAIGAAPAVAFERYCDAFLIGGSGRGGNAHGANEFLTLEGYRRFLASVEYWLLAMGDGS